MLFVALVGYYFLNRYLGLSIPCLFHELTGLYCPGCGVTRMLFSLLKLDFYQAFRYNPLLFIMLVIYIFFTLFKVVFKKKIIISEKVYFVILILVIIYGILRNISMFDYLKPTLI